LILSIELIFSIELFKKVIQHSRGIQSSFKIKPVHAIL